MDVRWPLLHWLLLLFLVKKWDLPPSFSTSNPLIRKSSQNWASCIFWGHLISWDLWKKFLFSPPKHRRVPWLSSHGMEAEAAALSWLPDPESAFPLLRESKRNPENFVSDGTKISGTSIGLWVDLSFPLLIHFQPTQPQEFQVHVHQLLWRNLPRFGSRHRIYRILRIQRCDPWIPSRNL